MREYPYILMNELILVPELSASIILDSPLDKLSVETSLNKYDGFMFIGFSNINLLDVNNNKMPKYGLLVKIIQTLQIPDGSIKVLLKAIEKVRLDYFYSDPIEGIFLIKDKKINKSNIGVSEYIYNYYKNFIERNPRIDNTLIDKIKSIKEIDSFLDLILPYLAIEQSYKIELFEEENIEKKEKNIVEAIISTLQSIDVDNKIEEKLRLSMGETQKQYYLKEKLRAIQEELYDNRLEDELDIDSKIELAEIPDDLKEKLKKESKRLNKMQQPSGEFDNILNYINTVLSLPWNKKDESREFNIKNIKNTLDADHYGLEKVKEAIIENLAIKTFNKSNNKKNATILCLVGPPGIGKTSLASSIAEAMGRNFQRIALGGIRDEAEIRGHRRTYVGAMMGRIMAAINRAGTNNPLILLDEIDKLGMDYKGDPSDALLEALDPEQNASFEDRFIDYPFDLSNVFFICTANDYTIPRPLLDRMEIIELSSYTELEKLNIAKKHLIKEINEETGINNVKITDTAIKSIINNYTREAGVRSLRRVLMKIYKKIAIRMLENNDNKKYSINLKNLKEFLGHEIFKPEKMVDKKSKLGIVNGLAWTAVGGTTLEVQAIMMNGTGKLLLTGKLGDVMKESANVAYSFVRTLEPENKFYKEKDIHLHFPEGAVPKDGPSAGITITTALLSVVTNKKIRQNIAMTGEITIAGEVLPVGGITEKVMGALRVGITEVILPYDNKVDIEKIPEEIRKKMKFHFVKVYNEVKDIVFE